MRGVHVCPSRKPRWRITVGRRREYTRHVTLPRDRGKTWRAWMRRAELLSRQISRMIDSVVFLSCTFNLSIFVPLMSTL